MTQQADSRNPILQPFLCTLREELCVRCRNAQTLDRVLISDFNCAGDPTTIEKITEYRCNVCSYIGPHDYPLFIRRQGLKPSYLFILSKNYDARRRKSASTIFDSIGNYIASVNLRYRGECGGLLAQETAELIRESTRQMPELSIVELPEIIRAAPFEREHLSTVLTRTMIDLPVFEARVRDGSRSSATFNNLLTFAGFRPLHLWQEEISDEIRNRLRDIEAKARVLDATNDLQHLIDRHDKEGVARLATIILNQSYGEYYPGDIREELLPFSLNLAWALAISREARLVISPDEALETLESAIGYLRTRNEPSRLASALNNLGSIYMACRKGNLNRHLAAAKECFEQAAAIYYEIGDEFIAQAGHVFLHASNVFRRRQLGDPSTNVEIAIGYVKSALEIFEHHGSERDVARGLSYLGVTHINRGIGTQLQNWLTAHEAFSAASEIWNKLYVNDPSLENSVIEEKINLGSAKTEVGRLTNDIALIESAIDILKPTCESVFSNNRGEIYPACVELLIAYCYFLKGKPQRNDVFEDALALAHRLEAWILEQPDAYLHEKTWPLANVSDLRGLILMVRGETNQDLAMLDRAAEAVQKAKDGFEKMGFGYRNAETRMNLANSFVKSGELKRAEKLYKEAASDARERARIAISHSSTADLSRPVYMACQQLAFLQAQRGELYEAICTLESAFALSLQKAALFMTVRDTLDKIAAARFFGLVEEYQSLCAAIEARNVKSIEDVENKVRRIKELDTAISAITRKNDPGDVTIDKASLVASIPKDGALLVPLVSDSGGLWVCLDNSGGREPRVTKVVCPELSGKLRWLIGTLPHWEHVYEALLSDTKTTAISAASEMSEALKWLGNTAGKPLYRHLTALGIKRGAKVGIVGHGLLSLVPFHAAMWRDNLNTEVLGSIYDLISVPSLIWLLRHQNPAKTSEQNRTLVVSDSEGDLPGSRLEGQAIARQLGDKNCILLSGNQAKRAQVIEELSSTSLLHFAGHSDFDFEMPFFSFLKMTCEDKITVADLISQVKQAPATVILSSCASGMNAGFQESGESWGFPYALHSWGVRTVISNLWDTLDVANLLFFSEFYNSDNASRQPATAFRNAQAYLRSVSADNARTRLQRICEDEPEILIELEEDLNFIVARYGASSPFSHPAFWAATFCSGAPVLNADPTWP